MHKDKNILYSIWFLNFIILSTGVAISVFSALRGAAFWAEFIFLLKNTLVVAPAILNLLIILFSFYLMLTGVYRWGINQDGAYSRTLIGLFILHATSKGVPFIPYLALVIELVLCYRNYRLSREEEETPSCSMASTGTVIKGSQLLN